MNTIGSFAATDVYFVAACLAFILGVIVGSILAVRRGKTEEPAPAMAAPAMDRVEFDVTSRRVRTVSVGVKMTAQEIMMFSRELILLHLVGKMARLIIQLMDVEISRPAGRGNYLYVRGTLRIVEPEKGPWYDKGPDKKDQETADAAV